MSLHHSLTVADSGYGSGHLRSLHSRLYSDSAQKSSNSASGCNCGVIRGFLRTFSSCLVASVCTWPAHLLNKCWSEKILSHFRVMWGSANISALSCRMSLCLSPTLMWSGCVAAGLLCKLPFGFKYMLQIAKLSFCSWFLLYSQTTLRSTKVQCMLWSSWKQVVEYTGRSQK